MFSMFNQIFAAFRMLFSAAEKGASALNNLATIGDEMSGLYADEQRIARQQRVLALNKQTLAIEAE